MTLNSLYYILSLSGCLGNAEIEVCQCVCVCGWGGGGGGVVITIRAYTLTVWRF